MRNRRETRERDINATVSKKRNWFRGKKKAIYSPLYHNARSRSDNSVWWEVALPKDFQLKREKKKKKNTSPVTHLCDHLSPGLISFTVIGFFLELLYHPLPGGSVLERELGHDTAELVRLRVLHPVQRDAQPEDEFVESIYDPPVHYPQHDYPLRAVGQEVWHSASTKSDREIGD